MDLYELHFGHPTFQSQGRLNEVRHAKILGTTLNWCTTVNVDSANDTWLESHSGHTTHYCRILPVLSFCQMCTAFSPMTDSVPLFSLISYAKFLRRTRAAITIQKHWRMYVVRRRYKITRAATVVLQSYWRGYLARNRYRKVRHHFQLRFAIPLMLNKYHI